MLGIEENVMKTEVREQRRLAVYPPCRDLLAEACINSSRKTTQYTLKSLFLRGVSVKQQVEARQKPTALEPGP